MNIFKKVFDGLKSAVVTAVVEKEVNKFEDKVKTSAEPMKRILGQIFGIYSVACDKVIDESVDFVECSKGDIIKLVAENADTLQKIQKLVESLDTERNRYLIKSIAESALYSAKKVNREMEECFDSISSSIKSDCDVVDTTWGLVKESSN